MRTLADSPICSVKWTAEQPPREQCYTASREAHSIANTKHPCRRETVQEKQHALRYKQQFMANGWRNRGNSDSLAAMHTVLGHLFVFIPFHKFVQQNGPWRERRGSSVRAGGVVEVQHLPNTHGHRVQLERGRGRAEGRGGSSQGGRCAMDRVWEGSPSSEYSHAPSSS